MKNIFKKVYLRAVLALFLTTTLQHSTYAMEGIGHASSKKEIEVFLTELEKVNSNLVIEQSKRNTIQSMYTVFHPRNALSLDDLKITILPDSIENLVTLDQFCVSKNQLTTLPNTIGKLDKLQVLRLDKNKLTTLPDDMGKLVNLKILDLSDNELTTLPDSMGDCTSLEKVWIRNNPQLNLTPLQLYNLLKGLKKQKNPFIYLDNTGVYNFLSSKNVPMSGSGQELALKKEGIQHCIISFESEMIFLVFAIQSLSESNFPKDLQQEIIGLMIKLSQQKNSQEGKK
jgi:hypothetical protein